MDELRRRRRMLACRQGGRAATRRFWHNQLQEERRPRGTGGLATSHRRDRPSSRGASPRHASSRDASAGDADDLDYRLPWYRRNTGCVPAGYRSSTPPSVSSLSSGGLTSNYGSDCSEHSPGWGHVNQHPSVPMATDQPATESLTSEVTHVSGYVPEPLWDTVEYDTMIAEERRNVPVGVYMPPPPPSATPPCLVECGSTPPFADIGVPDGTDLAAADQILNATETSVDVAALSEPPHFPDPVAAPTAVSTAVPSTDSVAVAPMPSVAADVPPADDAPVVAWQLPELEPPDMSTRQLAAMSVSAMANHRVAGVDVIQDTVQRMIRRATPAQRRTINLAIDFGCELMREASGQVLLEISSTFGDMPHMPYENSLLSCMMHCISLNGTRDLPSLDFTVLRLSRK